MKKQRKTYNPQEKAKIALEALKGELTQSQLTSKYGVQSTLIRNWKRQLKKGVVDIFKDKRRKEGKEHAELMDELYKQIGQLKVEVDWLKKKSERFD